MWDPGDRAFPRRVGGRHMELTHGRLSSTLCAHPTQQCPSQACL